MAAVGGGFIGKIGGKIDDVLKAFLIREAWNIATKIWNGHAFTEHISDFTSLGISTKEGLKLHIDNVVKKSTWTNNMKLWTNWRVAFWGDVTSTIVIYDPKNIDFWTTFIPWRGKAYFNDFN